MTNNNQTTSNSVPANTNIPVDNLVNLHISITVSRNNSGFEGIVGEVNLVNSAGKIAGTGFFKAQSDQGYPDERVFLMNSFAANIDRNETYHLEVAGAIKFTYTMNAILRLGGNEVARTSGTGVYRFSFDSQAKRISGADIIDNNHVGSFSYTTPLPNSVELYFY